MRAVVSAWWVAAAIAGAVASGCGATPATVSTGGSGAALGEAASAAPAALAIAPLAIRGRVGEATDAPVGVIDLLADGTIRHPRCAGAVRGAAIVDPRSERSLVRFDREARSVEIGDRALFRVEGERLLRADGRAISLDGERVVVEGSAADLGLEVTGASTPALRETALVLIAFLATCEG